MPVKAEIHDILIETDARRDVITQADTAGRGMLVVAVSRLDEPLPGGGFFQTAESKGGTSRPL